MRRAAFRKRRAALVAWRLPLLLWALPCLPLFAQAPAVPKASPDVRVIVFPFEVHSAAPLDYLQGSLTDLLLTRVSEGGRVEAWPAPQGPDASGPPSEQEQRALARKRSAQWVVSGSLTELAGRYSLDASITPAAEDAVGALFSYSADSDEALLDRIDELAGRIVGLATHGEQELRVLSIAVEGVPNPEPFLERLSVRRGDVFSSAALAEETERLARLPEVATADFDARTGREGVHVVLRVVPVARLMPTGGDYDESELVAAVHVRGNKRIEEAAIRTRIAGEAGRPFSPLQVADDVRSIHELGFFGDVRVYEERPEAGAGRVVVYEVKENPVVRQVTITGNDELDEEQIKDNMTLTTGSTLDLPLIFENRQRVAALYRAEGFYLAKVRYETEELPNDAVAVHFTVDEGKKLKLRSIDFVGNEAFSDEILMEDFKTRVWTWRSWTTQMFSKSGSYSEPIFQQDLRTIEERYRNNGYVRAEISAPEVDPDAEEKGLSVVVRIKEGPRFRVGSVDVAGDATVDLDRLRPLLNLKKGDVFSREALDTDIEILEHRYTDRGFYTAEVRPLTQVDDESSTVALTFEVNKGPLYFLSDIDITGNTGTVDSVLRREMQIVEGELYSARAIEISRRRVEVLGFFEEVQVEPKLTDHPELLDLEMRVVERPTGSLSFGAGYSSRDGFVLTGSISQSNLLGRGYGGSISLDVGSSTDRFFITFYDPYFRDSTFGLRTQAFRTSVEYSDFDLETLGAEVMFSHLLDNTGQTRGFLRYSWTQRDVDREVSASEAASPIVRELVSSDETASLLGISVRQDTRNDRIAPTAGRVAEVSLDIAGLGGFSKFVRAEASAVYYLRNSRNLPGWVPTGRRGTWVLGGRFGWAFSFNDVDDFDYSNLRQYEGDVGALDEFSALAPNRRPRRIEKIDTDIKLPLSERYFLGGVGRYQLRGFEGRSLGPRRPVIREITPVEGEDGVLFQPVGRTRTGECLDTALLGGDGDELCNDFGDRSIDDFEDLDETDVIGGNKFFLGSLEYRFPISEQLGLIGISFFDFGNSFSEKESFTDFDLWRMGTGIGTLWFSPFGPLQAFLGFPLDRHADEDSSVFEFSVGGQTF